MDRGAVTTDAALRRVAGWVALLAGGWLLLVADHPLQTLFGVAALAFGVLWLARFGAAADRPAGRDCLELGADGLRVESEETTLEIPWQETTGVALDEDRLQVLLMREGLDPVRIEPGYGGLPLRELAEMIHEWRCRQRPCIRRPDD